MVRRATNEGRTPLPVSCRDVDSVSQAFLDGEVADEDHRAVTAHLLACPRCAALLAERLLVSEAIAESGARDHVPVKLVRPTSGREAALLSDDPHSGSVVGIYDSVELGASGAKLVALDASMVDRMLASEERRADQPPPAAKAKRRSGRRPATRPVPAASKPLRPATGRRKRPPFRTAGSELVGQLIGGYKILAPIARGAQGTVYRAKQVSLEREVAFKVLAPHMAERPAFVKRFIREARAAAALDHTNIVRIFEVGEDDGLYWFSMELIEGESLAAEIARAGAISASRTVEIGIGVAEALVAASHTGVVHRDLKPANILIDTATRGVHLADLGLAKFTDDAVFADSGSLTQAGATMGSPNYMSPEQAKDPRAADAVSDIYGLGATLYHAVTGELPHRADHPMEVIALVLHDELLGPEDPFAQRIAPPVRRVLERMVAPRREDRFQSPAEALAALAAIDRDALDATPTPTPTKRVATAVVARPPRRGTAKLGKSIARAREGHGTRGHRRDAIATPAGDGFSRGVAFGAAIVAVGAAGLILWVASQGGQDVPAPAGGDDGRPRIADAATDPVRPDVDPFDDDPWPPDPEPDRDPEPDPLDPLPDAPDPEPEPPDPDPEPDPDPGPGPADPEPDPTTDPGPDGGDDATPAVATEPDPPAVDRDALLARALEAFRGVLEALIADGRADAARAALQELAALPALAADEELRATSAGVLAVAGLVADLRIEAFAGLRQRAESGGGQIELELREAGELKGRIIGAAGADQIVVEPRGEAAFQVDAADLTPRSVFALTEPDADARDPAARRRRKIARAALELCAGEVKLARREADREADGEDDASLRAGLGALVEIAVELAAEPSDVGEPTRPDAGAPLARKIDPSLVGLLHARRAIVRADGAVEVTYDFKDEEQRLDFVAQSPKRCPDEALAVLNHGVEAPWTIARSGLRGAGFQRLLWRHRVAPGTPFSVRVRARSERPASVAVSVFDGPDAEPMMGASAFHILELENPSVDPKVRGLVDAANEIVARNRPPQHRLMLESRLLRWEPIKVEAATPGRIHALDIELTLGAQPRLSFWPTGRDGGAPLEAAMLQGRLAAGQIGLATFGHEVSFTELTIVAHLEAPPGGDR